MIKMKVESNSRKLDLQTSRKHEVKTLGGSKSLVLLDRIVGFRKREKKS